MAKPSPKHAPAAESAPVSQPVKKKKSGLTKWLLLSVLLAGAGAAAWYFLLEPPAAEAKSVLPKPPVFVTLEPFTVNLLPEEGDKYLQVALVIKVADNEAVDAIKLYMPEVRNRILLLLSSKQASELITIEGKQKLSEEIVAETRRPVAVLVPQEKVVNVFFTSFVIQ